MEKLQLAHVCSEVLLGNAWAFVIPFRVECVTHIEKVHIDPALTPCKNVM